MKQDDRRLVMHVVFRFAVGGLENGIVNLINRLPADTWRHAVVALTDISDALRERVRRDDVTYVALGKQPGHAVPLYPALFRLFRSERPAIVHTRNLAALEVVVPAWAAGVPVRIHGEHGRDIGDVDGRLRRYQLVRRLYRPFVHQYVALSHDIERYLIERVHVPAARVEHIYNGVDTDSFQAAGRRAFVEGSPFTDPDLFVVGSVGRLDPVKDPINLVRGFAHAVRHSAAAMQKLRLVIVGDGPLRSEVEDVVRRADLGSRVWLAGERNDVARLMTGFDCFVLPSLAEGISNTILEAMASGLPVIATNVGANPDLVDDQVSGWIVPRANPTAIAEHILQYLADRALARRHGHAGRQIVLRRFSIDRMVNDYDALYRRLLRERGVAVGLPARSGRAGAGQGSGRATAAE